MLLSRVADALYWMSRYLERAEHTARADRRPPRPGPRPRRDADGWDFERPVRAASGSTPGGPCRTARGDSIDALVFDLANRGSVAACVTAARENARQVREEISSDMWEQLNALYLRLKQARTDGTWTARPHYLARLVIEGIHLFQGVTDATMGHGEGWQYLQAGRFLERAGADRGACSTCTSATAGVDGRSPGASLEWVGLLRSCAALEAYCRCYTADLRPERIAEFLLLNAEFPRSVRFAAARVEVALRAIAQLTGRGAGGRPSGSPAACARRSTTGRWTRS